MPASGAHSTSTIRPGALALSLAVGVFISFTPLYGLQTLLAIGAAVVLRLNRAATVAGTWLNLPWFAPVVYAGRCAWAPWWCPTPPASAEPGWPTSSSQPGSLSWRDLPVLLDHMSLPLFVGTSLLGGVAGIVTYVVSFRLISRRRAARESSSGRPDPGIMERAARDPVRARLRARSPCA